MSAEFLSPKYSVVPLEIAQSIDAEKPHFGFLDLPGYIGKGTDSYVVRTNKDEVLKFYLRHLPEGQPLSLSQINEYAEVMKLGKEWLNKHDSSFEVIGVEAPVRLDLNPVREVNRWNRLDCPVARSGHIKGFTLLELGDLSLFTTYPSIQQRIAVENGLEEEMFMIGLNRERIDHHFITIFSSMAVDLGLKPEARILPTGLNVKVVREKAQLTLMVTDLGVTIRDVVR